MKPGENLNNLSQGPRGSPLDSTTENNSFSSDSDLELVGSGAGNQKRIIQRLKRTIILNQTKINELTAKLTGAEYNLSCEKERTNDKEDLIKSLKLSIDVITQNKDLSIKCMQSQLNELQTALDSSKTLNVTQDNSGQSLNEIESQYKTKIDELNADVEILESKLRNKNDKLSELDDKTNKYESDLREKDEHIAKLESEAKLSLDTAQKYESDLREKDERIAKQESQIKIYLLRDRQYENLTRVQDDQIAKLESRLKTETAKMTKMEDKLSQLTLKAQTSKCGSDSSFGLVKIPSIKLVDLPKSGRFFAVLEDLPYAGSGWMVIQRRIDGSVDIHKKYNIEYYKGFGDPSICDLSNDFWFGCFKLHELTTSRRHELYVELVNFDDERAFARYDHFVVGSRKESFRLQSLGEYSGIAGDYLRKCQAYQIDAQKFASDKRVSYGWWHATERNLIGNYYDNNAIRWGRWSMGRGQRGLKSCKMLIRPTEYWMD